MPRQPGPKLTNVELVMKELNRFDQIIMPEGLFSLLANKNPVHQEWYRRASSEPHGSRLVAWKTGNPFTPENLFFRTLDTGRLLPMNAAEFRLQFWAHSTVWAACAKAKGNGKGEAKRGMERGQKGCEEFMDMMVFIMLNELLLLRNRIDMNGADIPIIVANWSQKEIDDAMAYWVDLSKDEWSVEEANARYSQISSALPKTALPCFSQVNCLVRALFADPEVGYLPPFLIITPHLGYSSSLNSHARVLFQNPSLAIPASLVQDWPTGCVSQGCPSPDCALVDLKRTYSLHEGSSMVRYEKQLDFVTKVSSLSAGMKRIDLTGEKGEGRRFEPRVLCNSWGCNKTGSGKSGELMLCQRCREVRYCGATCQKEDWPQHKLVCEEVEEKSVSVSA